MAKQIRDEAFRVMCDMWGVDAAVRAVKDMGVTATVEQIAMAKEKERQVEERWNNIFKPREE